MERIFSNYVICGLQIRRDCWLWIVWKNISAIVRFPMVQSQLINHLTPNGHFSGRTAPLTHRCCIFLFIQQIYVLNILNMLHTLRFFPLQNAVYFIMLPLLVPVLFTFFIKVVLKLKKKSGAKGLTLDTWLSLRQSSVGLKSVASVDRLLCEW